jgi:hypothetical protein
MSLNKTPAKEAVPASRIEQLGLSRLFQSGSTTSKAAELLLAGEPITRQELVRRTGVVDTVVPRTINRLREAGIDIDVVRDPVTKAATYTAKIPVIDNAHRSAFEFSAAGNAVSAAAVAVWAPAPTSVMPTGTSPLSERVAQMLAEEIATQIREASPPGLWGLVLNRVVELLGQAGPTVAPPGTENP